MDELTRWILTTLLPICVIGLTAYVAVRVKVAELNKDFMYIRDKVDAIEEQLQRKAEKEVADEIKADIKEIKKMFMDYILGKSDSLKKTE